MTEVVVGGTEEEAGSPAASAGQLLRQARERQQMSVQALASALKVPAHKLEALEEDRWEQLTDSVFARALALSVCRFLHLDPAPVLAGLPKYEAARLSTNPEGINTPFKDKTLRSSMSSSAQDSGNGRALKVVAMMLIVAAGAAGLYFVPHWKQGEATDVATTSVVLGEAGTSEPVFMPQAALTVPAAAPDVVAEPATEAAPAPVAEPVLAQPAAVQAAAPAAMASAALVVPSAPASEVTVAPVVADAATAAAAQAPLQITASGETWVQVRNAQQQVVMEKILKAGEVYSETRTGRPLYVVVGNASAAQVEVHGAALNLAALARNNVARFEVK